MELLALPCVSSVRTRTVLLAGSMALCLPSAGFSGVTTDGSLGRAATLTGPTFDITADLGRQAGNNLFHSFGQFSVGTGETAVFSGPRNIANIIGRVTGGQVSSIDGTVRSTINGANVYLLNPAGLIFGPNASLDVSGAFHASSADYLRFADGAVFHSTLSANSTFSAASPEAFGFLVGNTGKITVAGATLNLPATKAVSLIANGIDISNSTVEAPGGNVGVIATSSAGEVWITAVGHDLRGFTALGELAIQDTLIDARDLSGAVPNGLVELVGGNVLVSGSSLKASNYSAVSSTDRYAIYVGASGEIMVDGSNLWADSVGAGSVGWVGLFGDRVDVGNGAYLSSEVFGEGSGTVLGIFARNMRIGERSLVSTKVFADGRGSGGAIRLSAAEGIEISNDSKVSSVTAGYGAGGTIQVDTGYLKLSGGSRLVANTEGDFAGAANAGRIIVTARDSINVEGVSASGDRSTVLTSTTGPGRGGDIRLEAPALRFADGGAAEATSSGAGSAGTIELYAANRLTIQGVHRESGKWSSINATTYGPGQGGSIFVEAGEVLLADGGGMFATSAGTEATAGPAGNIFIRAAEGIQVSGADAPSGRVAVMNSSTYGPGAGGFIDITTRDLIVGNGGEVLAGTEGAMPGAGAGGMISINATNSVVLKGIDSVTGFVSKIDSTSRGSGRGGDVLIDAKTIAISGGATISSAAEGSGEGGAVIAKVVDDIHVAGVNPRTGNSSSIAASTSGSGKGGVVYLESARLAVTDGAAILAETEASAGTTATAGNIQVVASDRVTVEGVSGLNGRESSISTTSFGAGAGGTVIIEAGTVDISGGGTISASAQGEGAGAGAAGNISITAKGALRVNGVDALTGRASTVGSSTFGSGAGGGILLNAESVEVRNGAGIFAQSISTEAGAGAAGGIYITARDAVTVDGVDTAHSRNATINSSTFGPGMGGLISIEVPRLEVSHGGSVSANSFGTRADSGQAGGIVITTSDAVVVRGDESSHTSSISTTTAGGGKGGAVVIYAGSVDVLDGGEISARAESGATGAAGNIFIAATEAVRVAGVGNAANESNINTSTAGAGSGGAIRIEAKQVRVADGASISADTTGKDGDAGPGGHISVYATELIEVSGRDSVHDWPAWISTTGETGQGGSIRLESPAIVVSKGGVVEASSTVDSTGAAGSIEIAGRSLDVAEDGGVLAASGGTGRAGSIRIDLSDRLTVASTGSIRTSARQADGGNIDIRVGELVDLNKGFIVTSVGTGQGNGGNVTIDPVFVVLRNGSRIEANAYGGAGGNIQIDSDYLFRSPDSSIEASSALGVSGNVSITAPRTDVGAGLAVTSGGFLDASALLKEACATRAVRGPTSALILPGKGGMSVPVERFGFFDYRQLIAETRPGGTLLARAAEHQAAGRRWLALADLERLKADLEHTPDANPEPLASGLLGQAQLLTGDLTGARISLESVLSRADNQPVLAAAVHNDLGSLAWAQDRPKDATTHFDQARRQASGAGNQILEAQSILNSAQLLWRRGLTGDARAYLDANAAVLDALTNGRDFQSLLQWGRLQGLVGNDVEAERRLRTALDIARRSASARDEMLAWGYLGEMLERRGQFEEALFATRRAVSFAQTELASDTRYLWNTQWARLLHRRGDLEGARAAYRNATEALEASKHDFALELRIARQSYREAVAPVYLGLADLLLRQARQQGAERAALIRDARNTIEKLKAVELQDYFQDECVAEFQSQQRAIDRLASDTAILYPVVLAERVEMILSIGDNIQSVVLEVAPRELIAEAALFRARLEKRTTNEFLSPARRLYKWMIKPLEPLLSEAGVDTLVVIPDGPLRTIPFSALHDGENYLVERWAVAVVPGLNLVEPKSMSVKAVNPLLNGLTKSVAGFPELPGVDPEIMAIQAIFGGKVLKDEDFQIARFGDELQRQRYSFVHIASHGQFETDVAKSFVLAFDGKLTMNTLEAFIKRRQHGDEPLEVLALSACRTAVGDDRAALGLAGIALKAGARSAVASLWYVNDEASSQLITDFYRNLAAGSGSKAKALRLTQVRMLKDVRFRHPSYWAAFLLIGNWL